MWQPLRQWHGTHRNCLKSLALTLRFIAASLRWHRLLLCPVVTLSRAYCVTDFMDSLTNTSLLGCRNSTPARQLVAQSLRTLATAQACVRFSPATASQRP